MNFIKNDDQANYVNATLRILADGENLDLAEITRNLGVPEGLAEELHLHFMKEGYVKEDEVSSNYVVNREGVDFCKKECYDREKDRVDDEQLKITSDADINAESIASIMRKAPLKTKQYAISIPKVKRFYNLYKKGKDLSAIKVCQDSNIIVDGNHRYIAGRFFGIEVETKPAGIAENWKQKPVIGWGEVHCDEDDWG